MHAANSKPIRPRSAEPPRNGSRPGTTIEISSDSVAFPSGAPCGQRPPWIRFGFRAVLGRRRSEGASNGGLFYSSPYRAFQRVVEPARDRSNSVIVELSEQG